MSTFKQQQDTFNNLLLNRAPNTKGAKQYAEIWK